MARARVQLEHQRDFTGGLNLADDPYNLAPAETFDLLNVDIDRRGGFGLRRGFQRFLPVGPAFAPGNATADSGYTYVDTSGVRHILASRGGVVLRWDGAAWQSVRAPVPISTRTRYIEYGNLLYLKMAAVNEVPHTWNGAGLSSALAGAAGAYNNDLTAPAGGIFPSCFAMASHKEVAWAGGVIDNLGVDHQCRLRWSHPGSAQDWRENDYIDIDPDDENGRITALLPFGDRLLVFKDKAVYAVHGYPPAGFSVENLTKELGTPSNFTCVATESVVYFWDKDRGVYRYDGRSFEWVFKPLYPLIDDGKINMQFTNSNVIVEWHRDRLWVSVPYLQPPYAGSFVTLVFQPNAGKTGAWTIYNRALFGWWVHRGSAGGDEHLIGGFVDSNGGHVYEADVEGLYQDQSQTSGDFLRINAHYTTRWFDAGNPAMKKRWKRPVVIMRGGSNQVTTVEVLHDYDPTRVVKTFQLITTLDGDELAWDVDNWDEANWAREVTISGDRSVINKGSSLSGGVARALRFRNTTIGQDWRVHGLTMKWIPRNIRN